MFYGAEEYGHCIELVDAETFETIENISENTTLSNGFENNGTQCIVCADRQDGTQLISCWAADVGPKEQELHNYLINHKLLLLWNGIIVDPFERC